MRLWRRTRDQMPAEARAVLREEPPQDNAMGIVLNAWEDLLTCRTGGFGDGRIPWTAAMAWCDRHELDADAARVLWQVIKRLDIADLERRSMAANRPAGR